MTAHENDRTPRPATHGPSQAGSGGAAHWTLFYARAAILDIDRFEDSDILWACETIITQSPDPEERARAHDLKTLIEGEADAQ